MAGRLVLLETARAAPAGQLTWRAWEVLRSGAVVTADAAHPQLAALAEAGVRVAVVPVADVEPTVVAEQLLARAHGGEVVVWLASDVDGALAEELERLVRTARSRTPYERVVGSTASPLLDAVAVMDRLRSPGGCPWDAEQTHDSLKPYLLEEAYEAYEALEEGDSDALREELGDVLLQVLFHARLAQERPDGWSVDDVAAGLVEKLVGRHPHVFAGVDVADADEVERNWKRLKDAEKGRTSAVDGVPMGQPALSLAAKLQKRVGGDVPAYDGLGGELWALVARCRAAGVDPEAELRAVARRFRDEVRAAGR